MANVLDLKGAVCRSTFRGAGAIGAVLNFTSDGTRSINDYLHTIRISRRPVTDVKGYVPFLCRDAGLASEFCGSMVIGQHVVVAPNQFAAI